VSYHLAPDDALRACPYEPKSHHILESRFTTHLSKCMRNYEIKRLQNPNLPKIIPCQYNWKHHIVIDLMDEHLRTCPDAQKALQAREFMCASLPRPSVVAANRVLVVAQSLTPVVTLNIEEWETGSGEGSSASGSYNNATVSSFDILQDEDWEAEAPGCPADKPFYDPKLVLDQGHVFFMPSGLAPAERKKYRARLVAQYYAQEHKHELPPYPFNN